MAKRKRIHGKKRRQSAFLKKDKNFPGHDTNRSVLTQGRKSSNLDDVQAGLSAAGLVYPMADAANAVISAGRGIYHLIKGNKEESSRQFRNTALNTAAIIPGGELLKLNKFSKPTKQVENLYDAIANPNTTKTIQSIGNIGYWDNTIKHVKSRKNKLNQEKKSLEYAGFEHDDYHGKFGDFNSVMELKNKHGI